MKMQNKDLKRDECRNCCHTCGKNLIPIIITAVIIAFLVSAGIGVWQKMRLERIEDLLTYDSNNIWKKINAIEEQQKSQQPVVVNPDIYKNTSFIVACNRLYNWMEHGIVFNCPDGYYILGDSAFPDFLILTRSNRIPEGDISAFWTRLTIHSMKSLEEYIAEFNVEEIISQEKTIIGGREFTKLLMYSSFGNYNYVRYVLEFDGKLLAYKAGENEEELALDVLESMQF